MGRHIARNPRAVGSGNVNLQKSDELRNRIHFCIDQDPRLRRFNAENQITVDKIILPTYRYHSLTLRKNTQKRSCLIARYEDAEQVLF